MAKVAKSERNDIRGPLKLNKSSLALRATHWLLMFTLCLSQDVNRKNMYSLRLDRVIRSKLSNANSTQWAVDVKGEVTLLAGTADKETHVQVSSKV